MRFLMFLEASLIGQTIIWRTVRSAQKGAIHAFQVALFYQRFQMIFIPQIITGIVNAAFHLLQYRIRHLNPLWQLFTSDKYTKDRCVNRRRVVIPSGTENRVKQNCRTLQRYPA